MKSGIECIDVRREDSCKSVVARDAETIQWSTSRLTPIVGSAATIRSMTGSSMNGVDWNSEMLQADLID
ncbi:MAG: hypothetical protein AB7F86_10070 [Bdellovibrionales bacterium]